MTGAHSPRNQVSERKEPVLVVSLGRESQYGDGRIAAKDIECFERCAVKPRALVEAQGQEQTTSKKRRIRDSRRQDLGEMLRFS